MAVVNHNKKWLCLMEPHTASRCVAEFLKKNLGASNIGHHHISVEHLTDRARMHISSHKLSEYDILCAVRNPLDVLVTRWRFTGRGGMDKTRAMNIAKERDITFEEVMEDYHKNGYVSFQDWVLSSVNKPQSIGPLRGLYKSANTYMYYEQLEEDLSKIFKRPLKFPKPEKAHVTPGKKQWWEHYMNEDGPNMRLLEIVVKSHFSFMQEFGYELYFDSHGRPHMKINKTTHNKRVRPVRLP